MLMSSGGWDTVNNSKILNATYTSQVGKVPTYTKRPGRLSKEARNIITIENDENPGALRQVLNYETSTGA